MASTAISHTPKSIPITVTSWKL